MKESTFKKWHLISWEPEILISGGLILTLFNIKPRLVELFNILAPYQNPILGYLTTTLTAISATLTVGFTLHLIMRGLWIMKMGIAVTYSKPFDPESFSFRSIFNKRISKIDLSANAKTLGDYSGFVFSITFFLMLLSIGFSISTSILYLIGNYFGLSNYFVLGLSLLLFADFISFGFLKRTRLGVVLYPILYFLYLISLSFLYKDIYYHLIQNVGKPKLVIGFFLFITLSLSIGYANVRKVLRLPELFPIENRFELYRRNVYEDERDPFFPYRASISSYYQDKEQLKLYIHETGTIDEALEKDAVIVHINGERVIPKKVRNYMGPEKQYGYMYFIDIAHLDISTEHYLEILIDNSLVYPEFQDRFTNYYEFPFYKI